MRKFHLLCVDDEPGMLEVCQDTLLRLSDVEVSTAANPIEALKLLAERDFDLVVTDIQMPGMSGIEMLRKIREAHGDLPVVIMTGFPSVETAVSAVRLGAVDYVTKPFHPDDLTETVRRLLQVKRLSEENRLLKRRLEGRQITGEMLGVSPAMLQVFDTIQRIANSDVDVLIQGETGSGKELVARAIHRHSQRLEAPFVPVNCGAIPENLLEAEFFGYEKGAFTGASARSLGLLEYANGGTLFLDEIIEMPLQMQAKLLRALQERRLRRLGGKDEIPFSVRVISATARDLSAAVKDNVFREDLFYRLNVVTIWIPPLRDRPEDIELLTEHFIERFAHEANKNIGGIAATAMQALSNYKWPGNVRELQNVLRRAIALTRSEVIQIDDLPTHVADERATPLPADFTGSYNQMREQTLERFERDFVQNLLSKHHGDVTAAAHAAGLPRGSLYRLLKKLTVDPAQFREKR